MKPWQIVVAAIVALLVVTGLAGYVWMQIGDVQISWIGILAMIGGALATLALGVGLMALVFYSNRRGYDDDAGQ